MGVCSGAFCCVKINRRFAASSVKINEKFENVLVDDVFCQILPSILYINLSDPTKLLSTLSISCACSSSNKQSKITH